MASDGKAGEEGLRLRGVYGAGVTLAAGEDEASDPGDVRLLGAWRVVATPDRMAHLVEEMGWG